MKCSLFVAFAVLLILGLAYAGADQSPANAPTPPDMPPMPTPQAEHQWLEKFVGEWQFTTTVYMDPDNPMSASGTESVRSIGGFWIIGESVSDMMGMPMTNVITFGYDPQREKYVGVSVDSVSTHIWQYEGDVDPQRDRFTMTWRGPCPIQDGQLVNFRGVTQFHGNDRRVFTAEAEFGPDEWRRVVQVDFRRKD